MNLNVYTVYVLISTEPAPQASVSSRRATFGGNVCPKLFTSGLKRVLGLNLPVVFELCLRLSFIVGMISAVKIFHRRAQLTHVTHLTNLFCCLVCLMILKL